MSNCTCCDKVVSSHADRCPHCGEPDPAFISSGADSLYDNAPTWTWVVWSALCLIGAYIGWNVGFVTDDPGLVAIGVLGGLVGGFLGLCVGIAIGNVFMVIVTPSEKRK